MLIFRLRLRVQASGAGMCSFIDEIHLAVPLATMSALGLGTLGLGTVEVHVRV